jgi:uncharacterized phage protein (TIGR01671 family)
MNENIEIKFRAWNIKEKRMLLYETCDWLEISMDGKIYDMRYHGSDEEVTDEYIIMQFTGLRDKNGTEIYEGDILKSVTLDNKEHFQDVFFKDGAFRLRTGFDTTLGCHLYKKRIIAHEVIGNIYENPELLEVK